MKANHIKINGQLEMVLEDVKSYNKYLSKLSDGQEIVVHYLTHSEVRTLKTNRFMWKIVYGNFVPDHFPDTNAVHLYYGKEYLIMHDIIDIREDDITEFMRTLVKEKANILKVEPIDNSNSLIGIDWVRSTTKLSKKEMSTYLSQIMADGADLGLEFSSINDYQM